MKQVLAFLLFSILSCFSLHAQAPDPSALPKVKTLALVVRATTSISCGDGSDGTCVRTDRDVITKVTSILDGTNLWEHFVRADATKADAILEFTVKDAGTTYGRISFSVRDADNNKFLYFESRDVVMLENDITRIVNHFLAAVEDAKKKPTSTKKR
jgi:hypothetical protein